MPSRKSPRKNQGMQPGYYGHTNEDSPVITRGKTSAKPPAKKRNKIGYKLPRKKLQPPPRKNYTKSSSESSEYEDDSESDDEDKGQGLVIDVSNKKRKMAATISKRGRRGEQTYQSQNYERVFSTMKTMMMMMMMKRKTTMTTVAHHG
jgi:hypothetical protein